MVWNQLKTIYDPEIPVNIVDLGLIYSCVSIASSSRRLSHRNQDVHDALLVAEWATC